MADDVAPSPLTMKTNSLRLSSTPGSGGRVNRPRGASSFNFQTPSSPLRLQYASPHSTDSLGEETMEAPPSISVPLSEPLLSSSPSEEAKPVKGGTNSYWATGLVCVFTFLLAFKPSQPHMAQYLREVKGFTQDQIVHQIFPVASYSQLVLVLLQGYICEFVGYKFAIIIGVSGRVCTRMCMLYGTELWHFQMSEVGYSLGSAMLVIFGAYIFNLVSKADYQRITAMQQVATLAGHVSSGYLGDVLINYFQCDLVVLMYISAVSVVSSWFVSFLFPQVSHRDAPSFKQVAGSVKSIYANPTFLLMLLLWCVLTSVHSLVWGYETSLYDYIRVTQHYASDFNGTVASTGLLMGTIAAMLSTHPWIQQQHIGHPHKTMVLEAWAIAACIYLMCGSTLLYLSVGFIAYFGCYTMLNTSFAGQCGRFVTAAPSHAHRGGADHFAALFTANYLISQAMQTTLTWVVYTELQLDVHMAIFCMCLYVAAAAALATVAGGVMHFVKRP